MLLYLLIGSYMQYIDYKTFYQIIFFIKEWTEVKDKKIYITKDITVTNTFLLVSS